MKSTGGSSDYIEVRSEKEVRLHLIELLGVFGIHTTFLEVDEKPFTTIHDFTTLHIGTSLENKTFAWVRRKGKHTLILFDVERVMSVVA